MVDYFVPDGLISAGGVRQPRFAEKDGSGNRMFNQAQRVQLEEFTPYINNPNYSLRQLGRSTMEADWDGIALERIATISSIEATGRKSLYRWW